MPRKDRTFSDKDIVRLTIHNLTRPEKVSVLEVLCGITTERTPMETMREKREVDTIKIELEIARETLRRLGNILDVLEKIPGPQKNLLTAINKFFSVIAKVFDLTEAFIAKKGR